MPSPQSSEAPAPASTATPSPATPAPDANRVYTAAETRANILARTGAADMGAFHPAAPARAPGTPDAASAQQPSATPAMPAAPPPAAQPAVADASELTTLRAELAALQARARHEDEQPKPIPAPAAPDHPLAAHAKNVLGPGAQPHHIERTVALLEQGMHWQAFLAHHKTSSTPASAAEIAKAEQQLGALKRQIDDISERAHLHAQIAELSAARAQPSQEQKAQQRAQLLERVLADPGPQAMGMHPNLLKAMQAKPEIAASVKAYLLSLPDNEKFTELGNAYLHQLDGAYAATAATAPVAHAPQPAPTASPAANLYPITRQADPDAVPHRSRNDFWADVNNKFAARGRA